MSVHWCAVTRRSDNSGSAAVVLAEAGDDAGTGGGVASLAKKLIKKGASPGWEFEKSGALKGLKFHVHERVNGQAVVWAVCCVYEATLPELHAKGFLEKIALLCEPLRSSPLWRTGGTLCAQASFAPTLLQRMQQVKSQGKLAMVSHRVDEAKQIMGENIELLLDRGDRLDLLEEKATGLAKLSQQFHKRARQARRFQMWQQAKWGVAVGSVVTAGVALAVVPPLVAAL